MRNRPWILLAWMGPLVAAAPAQPPSIESSALRLCINEFMPGNVAAHFDENGQSADWIELHNPNDNAVRLAGWTISDDATDPDRHALSTSLEVPAHGYLMLYADQDPASGAEHITFSLSADGGDVALFDPYGNGQVIHYGVVQDDFSVARVEDCCTTTGCLDWEFRGTPGASNTGDTGDEIEVLAAGALWRYWDQGASPGTTWMATDFDDTAWPAGPAPLGFGDSFQVTVIDGGSSHDRNITTWFRKRFDLGNGPILAGRIGLAVDDGARVWLNGTEVLRVSLPAGPLTDETYALVAAGDAAEYTMYWYSFDASVLTTGQNTLAVEVHQASATSSDLNFDLSMTVTAP